MLVKMFVVGLMGAHVLGMAPASIAHASVMLGSI